MIRPPLFKYMSFERLLKTLKAPTVRFTQPDALNDPYECHLTLDRTTILGPSSYSAMRLPGPYDNLKLYFATQHYKKLRSDVGVVSLSEDPLNLLMWSHYGENHRGAVVELDVEHPCLNIKLHGDDRFSDLWKVNYAPEKVYGAPIFEDVVRALSTKSPQWSYEREWRLVRTLNLTHDSGEGVHIVEVDPAAIRTIYLGARTDLTEYTQFDRVISERFHEHQRPKVYKVGLSSSYFILEATDVEHFDWGGRDIYGFVGDAPTKSDDDA